MAANPCVITRSRCCPCMKNGHCIRCLCVKNGRKCVDCWPSRSRLIRCKNIDSVAADSPPTLTPASPTSMAHQHTENSTSQPSQPSPMNSAPLIAIDSSNGTFSDSCVLSSSDSSVASFIQRETDFDSGNHWESNAVGDLKRFLWHPCRRLKWIPRGSWSTAAKKLACLVNQVTSHNDVQSWDLLRFPKLAFVDHEGRVDAGISLL